MVSAGRAQFGVIEKLRSACYFQIALETMLLPILIIYYQINCRINKIGQQELLWVVQTSTVNQMLLWQSSGGKI